jgi:hypothetical protein
VNEVPPISGAEAGVSGTARLTFNLTRSASGAIDTATLESRRQRVRVSERHGADQCAPKTVIRKKEESDCHGL